MRNIRKIILHSTATPAGREVTVADVDRWHRDLGYDGIGYHYLIGLDGTVHAGRPLEKAGAHCRGHNSDSIGIAYAGGTKADGVTAADTRTAAQRQAMHALVDKLRAQYPSARLYCHRDLRPTQCPSFSLDEF